MALSQGQKTPKLKCFELDFKNGNLLRVSWRKIDSLTDLAEDLSILESLKVNVEQLSGSAFDKRVWSECSKVKRGNRITYSELAKRVGSPKAFRAVANSLGRNPIPIAVPCHRVVGKKSLGGYSCRFGIRAKTLLLDLEKNGADPFGSAPVKPGN